VKKDTAPYSVEHFNAPIKSGELKFTAHADSKESALPNGSAKPSSAR
jgi:hypothetical protein